jgi:DNA-directed RNA polymerase specialized sigma24 family protein
MLSKVVEKHDEWVNLANKLGSPSHLAEDVVQEMYIRLNTYATEDKVLNADGTVNNFYVFVALRNTLRLLVKEEAKTTPVEEFLYNAVDGEVDMQKEQAFSRLMHKIQEEADTWGAYHSKLFNLYFKTDNSMRQISKGTNIGLTHIYNNLKSYRDIIVEKFAEDYEDYLNADYEQI